MNIMGGDAGFERIDDLVNELLVRRSTKGENELCRMARKISGDKKLELIERLRIVNVRLAASIGVRVHLPVEQQLILACNVLSDGNSNAIKQMVTRLFVFRLSPKVMAKMLAGSRCKYPDGVRLMAYYYLNSFNWGGHKYKEVLVCLVKGE